MSAGNSVLEDVRRALGRKITMAPEALASFIEPPQETDLTARIARFISEATAVRARVHRCSQLQLVEKIAEICAPLSGALALSQSSLFRQSELKRELEARGLSVFDGCELDHGQLTAQLADCAAGLTAADYAIAETGTIALSSDERNSLLVSLLPPVHIAVIQAEQISATLAEAISLIGTERTGRSDPARSVSFITGPSRTSDVELVLSISVHGPKEVHVIILE